MDAKITAQEILKVGYETDVTHLLPITESGNSNNTLVKGSKEISTLASHMRNRILQQEERRQQNIEDTMSTVQQILNTDEHDYSQNKISSDWYFRYLAGIQDISDKDMQLLFARILAGEIREPGSISVLALNALRDMSKEDAEIFVKVSGYAVIADENNVFIPQYGQFFDIEKDYEDSYYGLRFDDLRILSELRLISTQTDTAMTFDCENESDWIKTKSGNIGIKMQNESKKIDISAWLYTRAGVQLYSLLSSLTPHKDFLYDRIVNKYRSNENKIVWGEIDMTSQDMVFTKEYE